MTLKNFHKDVDIARGSGLCPLSSVQVSTGGMHIRAIT